jgi:glyoxylase-like metal-dependent hydrolase (beta-lactamase superfamily II)
MRRARSAVLVQMLCVLVAGCSSAPSIPREAAITLAHADRLAHADARVGTYVSSNWGFSTNSYWIEGPDGLVLVDTQFLPSAAAEFVSWAERVTGKRAVLAVVLHANPDKFNGTETLQRRGIRVITSDQVRALVPGVFEKRTRAFAARYAPDWPVATPTPEGFGGRSIDLPVAGVTLRLHVLGPATSDAHVVLEWDGHLFTGDLVASQCHAWLELGHVDEWLLRMAEMRALHPTAVHPGRGPSAGPELLDAQEAYLRRVKELVLAEHPAMPVRADAIARIKETLVREHPDYDYDVFLGMGLPAVWEKYAAPH